MDTPLSQAILQGAKTYPTLENSNRLTLCDPITQICKRIQAFFRADKDVTCAYKVNNNKPSGQKYNTDGTPVTKEIRIGDEKVDAYVFEEHYSEFRILVAKQEYEKAQCLSAVVRRRHVYPEVFEMTSTTGYGYREHILLVRVIAVDGVDPDKNYGGGDSRATTEDDTESGLTELYGLEPINWNDLTQGCRDRLSPLDTSESDIPKGAPEEYEQAQWETNPAQCAWKWRWLKGAIKGNKNVTTAGHEFYDGQNTWRFIECSKVPVSFPEDDITAYSGITVLLPVDLFGLVFATFGKFQIGTYARTVS